MNETIKEILGIIFIIALFLLVICVIGYMANEWDDSKTREENKRREEFCRSFLDKDSRLYDRCLDAADDYNIK